MSGGAPAALPPSGPADTEADRWSEVELWHRLVHLMELAKQKQGKVATASGKIADCGTEQSGICASGCFAACWQNTIFSQESLLAAA